MAMQTAGLQSQAAMAGNAANSSYYSGLGQLLGYILANRGTGTGSSASPGAASGYGAWGSW